MKLQLMTNVTALALLIAAPAASKVSDTILCQRRWWGDGRSTASDFSPNVQRFNLHALPFSLCAVKIIQESGPPIGTARSLKGIAFRQYVTQKNYVLKGDNGKEKETDRKDKEEKKDDKKDEMVRNFDRTIEWDLVHCIYCG